MNNKINLYGRARRLALYRNIGIIVGCILAIVFIINLIFGNNTESRVIGEFDVLRNHFVDRGFTCEMLNTSGSKCTLNNESNKTTFLRFNDGFEYSIKTSSYSLNIVHRLDKKDEVIFKTTSDAFLGFRNQEFICEYENNVLDPVEICESSGANVKLNVKSYLGVIEQAQADLTNAVNSSGYSLDSLLKNYEWTKK